MYFIILMMVLYNFFSLVLVSGFVLMSLDLTFLSDILFFSYKWFLSV